jgi:U3 small nucleolar RNA-associated protein 12
VSGGSDATVKFWQFELVTDPNNKDSKAKVLSVLHTRTLKLEENVLCVRVSANSHLLAVALLDCTVKIFFVDSLKVKTKITMKYDLCFNLFSCVAFRN